MSFAIAKRAAAITASTFVQDGMTVGLGTGSTAFFLIQELGRRCREEGLKISCAASSLQTKALAFQENIPLLDDTSLASLDLTIDGADQIDRQKRLIKGGGGALLREKILASMSREMVVIADESKVVEGFEESLLPVEVVPFGWQATEARLDELGFSGRLRGGSKSPFVTDNNHYILDIQLPGTTFSPEAAHALLKGATGVVETGFFLGLAGRVVIGYRGEKVEVWQ